MTQIGTAPLGPERSTSYQDLSREIIRTILTGVPDTEVARIVGCGRSTVERRRRDPRFNAELAEAQRRRDERVLNSIAAAAERAAKESLAAYDDPSVPVGNAYYLGAKCVEAFVKARPREVHAAVVTATIGSRQRSEGFDQMLDRLAKRLGVAPEDRGLPEGDGGVIDVEEVEPE